MKNYLYLAAVCCISLAGCSSSSSTPDSTEGATDSGNNADSVLTGVFLDSAVSGVDYKTSTQVGTTNEDGEFQYTEGESVIFSIGALNLPEALAAPEVSPVDMSPTASIADNVAVNIARLLQSMDVDNNPGNGISISEIAGVSAVPLDFSQSPDAFSNDPNVINLVANSGSSSTVLISAEIASAHLSATLGQSDFVRIFTLETLNQEVVGREQLFEDGGRVVIRSDNNLELFNSEGSFVFGTWYWENSMFCRDIDPGDSGLPASDCQIFEINGDILRFTRNSGAGESATVMLASR